MSAHWYYKEDGDTEVFIGIQLTVSTGYEIFRCYPVAFSKYDNTTLQYGGFNVPLDITGLGYRAQRDLLSTDNPLRDGKFYGTELEFDNRYPRRENELQQMLKAIKAITRKLDRVEKKWGKLDDSDVINHTLRLVHAMNAVGVVDIASGDYYTDDLAYAIKEIIIKKMAGVDNKEKYALLK